MSCNQNNIYTSRLDPRWQSFRDLLIDRSMKPAMKLPAVGRIVMDGLESEAHLHRSFYEIFAEAADAR